MSRPMLFPMDGQLIESNALDVVETDRLRLERWDDVHFERFSRFMREPDVIRYIRPLPLDAARATEQHERSLEEWEINGFGKRAMIELATEEWIGFVELSRVGPGKGCRDEDVEIGYFVAPERWGEGIATEAALATRDEAFERAGLDELMGRCRVENLRSAQVLKKVGFQLLRHFDLGEGVAVEIHHIQRADWTGPTGRRLRIVDDAAPNSGTDYRETG